MRWDGYGVSAILLALLCAFAAVHAEGELLCDI
jgi:hypothetical protein